MRSFSKKYPFVLVLISLLLFAVLLATPALAKNWNAPGQIKPNPGSKAIQDPIQLDSGPVSGFTLDPAEHNGLTIRGYKGIPYADPPVGELRWMPPQSVEPWTETLECTQLPPYAPQGGYYGALASEDCLYLSLYTPARKTNDHLPVMVYFHGGGLSSDGANSPTYHEFSHLPDFGVVTVMVHHRLGPLGYMAHPLLSTEQGTSGNYGTMDLIASLLWVQNNIAAFGGDPRNVTIFGVSGGGTKVTSLFAAPETEGLFHRAGILSGHRTLDPDTQQPTQFEGQQMGEVLMGQLVLEGKLPIDYNLDNMRALHWEDIIGAVSNAGFLADLIVDGTTLPDQVSILFETGQLHDVPLIVGANNWENTMYGGITRVAEARASYGYSDTYVFVNAHMPGNWGDVYPVHGCDGFYIWGTFVSVGMIKNYLPVLAAIGHYPYPDPAWIDPPEGPWIGPTDDDLSLAEAVGSMWTRFAAKGRPSLPGQLKWPVYDPENPQYLQYDVPLAVHDWNCSVFVPECYPPAP